MSILVTGAAGFIGSHLSDRLLASGASVVGLDSFDDFYDPAVKRRNLANALGHDAFHLAEADIRDARALDALPDGIEAVVHLAARAGVRPSIEQPELYTDVNVLGTTRLLRWTADRGIRSFVMASSSSVYGNNEKIPFAESDPVDHPISPYAATKKACELLCHSASHLDGSAIACLRFFTAYGPRQRPDLAIHKFAMILRDGGEIPMFGDGSAARDYTHVDDIVSGVVATLDWVSAHPGEYDVFNLGNHRSVRLRDMIDTIASAMGVEPRIRQYPMQPGDVLRTYADISHARATLGFEPTVEFQEGIERFVQWFADGPVE